MSHGTQRDTTVRHEECRKRETKKSIISFENRHQIRERKRKKWGERVARSCFYGDRNGK